MGTFVRSPLSVQFNPRAHDSGELVYRREPDLLGHTSDPLRSIVICIVSSRKPGDPGVKPDYDTEFVLVISTRKHGNWLVSGFIVVGGLASLCVLPPQFET